VAPRHENGSLLYAGRKIEIPVLELLTTAGSLCPVGTASPVPGLTFDRAR